MSHIHNSRIHLPNSQWLFSQRWQRSWYTNQL